MTDRIDGSNEIYSKRIHPKDEDYINRLTISKNWDFNDLKKVLIACSIVGYGNKSPYYIPAHNVPETIHLGSLRKYIDDLNKTSKETKKEVCRTFMVNTENSQLIAGKRFIGAEDSTIQAWYQQDGLMRTLSIHTHPTGAGFSSTDYQTFVADPEQMVMIMTLGESTFMALKNTATPNKCNLKDVRRRIIDLEDEFFHETTSVEKVIEFNKTACLEFGLNLFVAQTKDLAVRVNIAK